MFKIKGGEGERRREKGTESMKMEPLTLFFVKTAALFDLISSCSNGLCCINGWKVSKRW